MSGYLGDFKAGATVRDIWATFAVAGQSITRGTNGTISVYKDGGLTQSVAGVTDTEDFDGQTGLHLISINTAADGAFYSAGSDFQVVVLGAVIDGKSINAPLFSFSIQNRVNTIFDEVIENSVSFKTLLKRFAGALLGKSDGIDVAGTGHFRNLADTVDRITVTHDGKGNRSSVTFNDS